MNEWMEPEMRKKIVGTSKVERLDAIKELGEEIDFTEIRNKIHKLYRVREARENYEDSLKSCGELVDVLIEDLEKEYEALDMLINNPPEVFVPGTLRDLQIELFRIHETNAKIRRNNEIRETNGEVEHFNGNPVEDNTIWGNPLHVQKEFCVSCETWVKRNYALDKTMYGVSCKVCKDCDMKAMK